MNMNLPSFLLLLFAQLHLVYFQITSSEYFNEIESMYMKHQQSQVNNVLKEDLANGFDSPKEIEILCPDSPVVSIRDIDYSANEENSICLTLKVTGPSFSFVLNMKCDDEENLNKINDLL